MDFFNQAWTYISWFVFLYPLALSILWTVLGYYFWLRHERKTGKEKDGWPEKWPPITILVPCYNEAAQIATTCVGLELIDYPNYEVVFIDDSSSDNTVEIIRTFLSKNRNFHLLRLQHNRGKALALNCAMRYVETSITVVIDADTVLTPESVKYLAAPFCSHPRLGAVTGNPLVAARDNILQKLQAAEFTSIIGLIKRAQRVISRVMTVSGCFTAYRTEIIRQVGGFSPYTATEDIDITWKIQRHFYEVWFMPQATAYIQCPSSIKEYWKQRKRWAAGGWHLLRTHCNIFKSLKYRYLYLPYIEFVLSFFWSFALVFGTLFWAVSSFFTSNPIGLSPIPAWYGSIVSLFCIIQMLVAIFMNRKYDKGLGKIFFWVPWYAFFLFIFGALAVVWSAPKGLFGSLKHAGKWESPKRARF